MAHILRVQAIRVEKSGQELEAAGYTLSREQKGMNARELIGAQLPSMLKQSRPRARERCRAKWQVFLLPLISSRQSHTDMPTGGADLDSFSLGPSTQVNLHHVKLTGIPRRPRGRGE